MNQPKSIVFLGAPRAGKTVFFSTVVKHFEKERQPLFHRLPPLHKMLKKIEGAWIPPAVCLWPNDAKCCEYVDASVSMLERGNWPPETKGIEVHEVKAKVVHHYEPEYRLIELIDCDGAIFWKAFSDPDSLVLEGSDEHKLRQRVANADCLCFIIDPQSLLPDSKDRNLQRAFLGALNHADTVKNDLRVAVVFTKSDLYDELSAEKWRSPEVLVNQFAPIVWNNLEEKQKAFFRVCCVRTELDNRGRRRPPSGWSAEHAEGIDKIVWWLMDDSVSARWLAELSRRLVTLKDSWGKSEKEIDQAIKDLSKWCVGWTKHNAGLLLEQGREIGQEAARAATKMVSGGWRTVRNVLSGGKKPN